MPVIHDLECSKCGAVLLNQIWHFDSPHNTHKKCGGTLEILWQAAHQRDAAVHASERSVVWYSPKEGKHQFPGTNDAPIPERLKQRGYERKELTSLRSIEQFEKQAKVASEVAWFDRGSGRNFDGD